MLDLENHHNFAWRERHVLPDGAEADVIVHRKGATPAGAGVLGIIPGSMGTPGYVVRGKGSRRRSTRRRTAPGRRMSRTRAKELLHVGRGAAVPARARRDAALGRPRRSRRWPTRTSTRSWRRSSDLVEPLARFEPRLVKMAPSGEPPED